MLRTLLASASLGLLLALGGCDRPPAKPLSAAESRAALLQARQTHQLRLVDRHQDSQPAEAPPPAGWALVKYPSPVGELSAYLTVLPRDAKPRAAIVWITGGDCNSIGDVWSPADSSDDQSARAFREAGIVTMYPSLRGGNGGPGTREGFFGEVDDVIAAADFLTRQPGVDPQRIYLGGHSTGGTLALLVAECSDRFRAVFSFGPVAELSGYPKDLLPFEINAQSRKVRSPGDWLAAINHPTFVFEGDDPEGGNIRHLQIMIAKPHSPAVRFFPVPGGDHFSILAPVTRLVAAKILADTGPEPRLDISSEDIAKAMQRR